jgi:DNA polymerase III epsilon subunit-like protein
LGRAFQQFEEVLVKLREIMIDNETLGTTADAVIISIGAVKFDLETGEISDEAFYRSISIDSNLEFKRRISEDTLIWWFKQDAAAQGVFHEPKEHLADVLVELSDWVGAGDHTIWSNGADFDIPMIAHAYTQCGVEIPWKFYNSRCYRTYKNLPGAKNIRVPATGVKHNALSDAYQQAQTVCEIHKQLFGKTVKAKA